MKLFSWNVNGIRAAQGKGFLDWLHEAQPDILGIQETKAQPDQLDDELLKPEGYHTYFASADKKGYSGVALYSRTEPLSVQTGFGVDEFDSEGRTLIAEYDDFVFITAYFPKVRSGKERLDYKLDYCNHFLDFCDAMRSSGKSVIFCGDINISHKDIDLANPKSNYNKTGGFLQEEIAWLDQVVDTGYIDTYRKFYPDAEGKYSWWSYRGGARKKNVGWRLDYFFVSPDLESRIEAAAIHADVMGSDHCPVSLTLK